jgi:dynein heavy chain 2
LEHSIGASVEIFSSEHPRFQHQTTLAIRFGKTLIVKEADQIPLCLFPFVSREFALVNGHLTVKIADKVVEVHPDFRLILVTRNSSIELTPRERSLALVVNFAVTKTALRTQLLSLALSTELPELEKQHQRHLNESEQLKIELGKLEVSLLDILAAANPKTILNNRQLIDSLDSKKKRAGEVEERLKLVEEFQSQIQEKRAVYQPLASIAASIYFVVENLRLIHPMYRFSLNEFTKLFVESFSQCRDNEDRVKKLTITFNSMTFAYFSRALFREHRLVFGLVLLKAVYPKMFVDPEWHFMLKQRSGQAHVPSFIPGDRRTGFMSLAAQFPELTTKLGFNDPAVKWRQWLEHPNPEANSSWPQIGGKSIQQLGVTPFQRILVLQALRPDRVLSALEKLVIATFKAPRTVNCRELLTQNVCFVFFVTPGSDPSIELASIGRDSVEVALGQCDSKEAISLVRQSARNGQLAILKNVHLDVGLLHKLEKLLPDLQPRDGFRLVLTTEAITAFPAVLLQNATKIAYEAPPGLLNQIKRTLTLWDEGWFNDLDKKMRRSLLNLAYLHGVLQERRAYLPVGWSQYFEFTQGNLNAATRIIEERNKSEDIVRGLLESTIYGSRMDSLYDRRICLCL